MAIKEETFKELLKAAINLGASDIHIREGETPFFRLNSELLPVESPPVSSADISSICKILLKPEHLKMIESVSDLDGGRSFDGICRVRYNLFRFQDKLGIIIRLIKSKIPSIEELGLKSDVKSIALQKRGLVLITGPTGSGKSSTMAAMINYRNRKMTGHIVTIEDPVEYLYEQNKCRITQREVGVDTDSYKNALKSSLRQDPDVITLGEVRDSETVDICLKASETGHFVVSTIHTNNIMNTIGRIIAMFPPEAQRDARLRLADNIYAIISQRLIKRSSGKGMVPAIEYCVTSPGIRNCIAGKEDMKHLMTYIKEAKGNKDSGGQTFNQAIRDLLDQNIVTKRDAIKAATDSGDFGKMLDLES